MAQEHLLTDTAWVVACLVPGDVAPHPNFSVAQPSYLELFALLAQARIRDFLHYRHKRAGLEGVSGEGHHGGTARRLVSAAYASFDPRTQRSGAAELTTLAGSDAAPPGLRAAAAIFASQVWAELDDLPRAIEPLHSALSVIPHEPESKSQLLVKNAVHQQLAFRSFELGDWGSARRYARLVSEGHMAKGLGNWDRFPTSHGVAWHSATSQRHAHESLLKNARSLLADLEGLTGRSWVDVVKSPIPAGDASQLRELSEGIDSMISEVYGEHVDPLEAGRTYHTEDPVLRPVQSALMNAEMTGNLGAARQRRELLGQLYVMRSANEEADDRAGRLSEAVRLFRHANSYKNLKPLTRQLRTDGPLAVLRSSAESFLQRRDPGSPVSRCDVLVLTRAADLLEPDQREDALRFVLGPGDDPAGGDDRHEYRSWTVITEAIEAAASLVQDSEADDYAAERVLDLLPQNTGVDDVLLQPATEFAKVIVWGDVSPSTRTAWFDWASARVSPNRSRLIRILGDVVGQDPPEATPSHRRTEDLNDVVEVIRERASGTTVEARTVERSVRISIDAMSKIRDQAKSGRYSLHSYNAGTIAVAMIDVFGREELWPPLVEFLTDERVSVSDKSPGLERLADRRPPMPVECRSTVASHWSSVLSGHAGGFFGGSERPAMVEGLRMGLAYGFVEDHDVRAAALSFITMRDPADRMGAARLAAAAKPAEWALLLLVQLSQDAASNVAAAASRSLASSVADAGDLQDLVVQRLTESLRRDGTLGPLSTMRGMWEADGQDVDDSAGLFELYKLVAKIRREHLSGMVRRFADRLLEERGIDDSRLNGFADRSSL